MSVRCSLPFILQRLQLLRGQTQASMDPENSTDSNETDMVNGIKFDPLDTKNPPEVHVYDHHGEQLTLYEDDMSSRKITDVLSKVNHYDAGLPGSGDIEDNEPPKKSKGGKLGTVLGVYLPCIQNIFGVILFIRLTWVVGMAGSMESFFIVLICCCTTLLTAISMSAIATNGVVPAGGSYFMISRALGPEFGGAVGVLFYLGTSVASSMYIIGAVEILITFMMPQMSIFGDINVQANAFNNFRVYGTCLLILLIICVIIGVAFVSKFAPISLFCVILSILSIYIGIFASNAGNSIQVCKLGGRVLTQSSTLQDGEVACTKNQSGPIFANYCGQNGSLSHCDPYFLSHDAVTSAAIPGIDSGIFSDNGYNKYTQQGNIPATDIKANRERGEIITDITTSFTVLLAIFFPSVTGIMAGSNRSGDLADAQRSIPTGTICAILTTSVVYLSCVLFFGATIDGDVMRDKFGESMGGGLVIANLAWPNPWVILVGSLLSTIGAGLQSLTGAPRLLQAIAKDGVIPFLRVFSQTTRHGEPLRAILLTAAISEIGILIASLDAVAPIISMFFLMCYGLVNMACALQTLLKTPNWRPRFRFYHWILSLLGLALCIALMFISSWIYSLVAIVLAIFIYKYIEYKGAEHEWGDGITGLAMSAARFALLRLEEGPVHTKNWRPQLLILLKLDDETLQPLYSSILPFGKQLKAGRGLTMVASVLPGVYENRIGDITKAKNILNNLIDESGIKGFSEITVAEDVNEGISHVIQSAGLGGMKPNTVVMGWPANWANESERWRMFHGFITTLKLVRSSEKCLLVLKEADKFPDSSEKLTGTIDVWWIVHEGGLLMLLPFLLRQHRTWRHCKLRIFTVAQLEDNSIKLKNDLEKYVYQLRIEAEVYVIEMESSAISAYTYERTLIMEQRNSLLKNMQIPRDKISEPQTIVDKCHTPGRKRFQLTSVPEESIKDSIEMNQFTFTPQQLNVVMNTNRARPNDMNVRRMHTAIRLNEVIRGQSQDAQLVVINMPTVPQYKEAEQNYVEYLEVLTEGIDRCLLARGSGQEVITIYS